MKSKSKEKNIKHSENLQYKRLLERNDPDKIAKATKYHPNHVRYILNGHSPMTDRIRKAIAKLVADRQVTIERINSIVKKSQ
jgi:hypothetical protein